MEFSFEDSLLVCSLDIPSCSSYSSFWALFFDPSDVIACNSTTLIDTSRPRSYVSLVIWRRKKENSDFDKVWTALKNGDFLQNSREGLWSKIDWASGLPWDTNTKPEYKSMYCFLSW